MKRIFLSFSTPSGAREIFVQEECHLDVLDRYNLGFYHITSITYVPGFSHAFRVFSSSMEGQARFRRTLEARRVFLSKVKLALLENPFDKSLRCKVLGLRGISRRLNPGTNSTGPR